MMYPTKLPALLATHQHHQSNYLEILDEVDPADNITIVASNKGKATDDATAITDKWTDEESTDDENVPCEQSVPILNEGNNQGPYLPSSPAYEISISAMTPIVPIIIPPPISIPTRSNANMCCVDSLFPS